MPSGGANKKAKLTASGNAEATSIGWRRPHRVLIRSDHAPISGSVTASITTEIAMASPTNAASTPTICW